MRYFSTSSPSTVPVLTPTAQQRVREGIIAVFASPDMLEKARLCAELAAECTSARMPTQELPIASLRAALLHPGDGDTHAASLHPTWPADLHMVPATDKRAHTSVRGEARVSLPVSTLHALAHIEAMAVHSYLDTAHHWCHVMHAHFIASALAIAADEARHFTWLQSALQRHGSGYGHCYVHDGLWTACARSRCSLLHRVASLSLVAEARALDSSDRLTARLRTSGDAQSAAVVARICEEEVAHVREGTRWFRYICDVTQQEYAAAFRACVPGALPPPFNHNARREAEMPQEWYMPLARPQAAGTPRTGKRSAIR